MAETILEVSKLTKSFDGGSAVLKEINFSIKKGEVVVVVGPSGCGKSTFLRCLNFLEQIDSGEILLDGKKIDTSAKALPKYREKIGMVFQSYELFPHKTVLENVMLAPLLVQKRNKAEVKAEAEKLLARVGVAEKKDMYPRQLSGGQKQRVAIAGVMAMEPKCIILDEPTAMLDPVGRKEVLQAVHTLNKKKGVTIVLITHYMEEVVDADYVYVMDKGSVVMQGAPREIFSQVDILKEHRLDVPQITLLADELRKAGLPLPKGILTREELDAELVELYRRKACQSF